MVVPCRLSLLMSGVASTALSSSLALHTDVGHGETDFGLPMHHLGAQSQKPLFMIGRGHVGCSKKFVQKNFHGRLLLSLLVGSGSVIIVLLRFGIVFHEKWWVWWYGGDRVGRVVCGTESF